MGLIMHVFGITHNLRNTVSVGVLLRYPSDRHFFANEQGRVARIPNASAPAMKNAWRNRDFVACALERYQKHIGISTTFLATCGGTIRSDHRRGSCSPGVFQ